MKTFIIYRASKLQDSCSNGLKTGIFKSLIISKALNSFLKGYLHKIFSQRGFVSMVCVVKAFNPIM